MGRLKLPAVYGGLTLAGITAESSSLVALSLGLSLFIPALFLLTARESLTTALITSVLSLGVLALYSLRAPLDVAYFQALGALFYKTLKRPAAAVLGGALILFLGAVVEELLFELLFGLPQEVKELPLFGSYRWGLYFFVGAILAEIAYALAQVVYGLKEGEGKNPFFTLRFGFWPVALFLITGALTLVAGGALKVVSVNLLTVSLGLFTAQGLSVIAYLVSRLSPLWRLLTALGALIFPVGLFATALIVGFLDNWLDFRKLSGGGSNGSNSA
jgi:hypothetical protein